MPSFDFIFVETVGWVGAALILFAYYLLTHNKIQGQSFTYQWMNLFGAAGVVINSGYHQAIPSLALNAIWFAIAAVALWNVRRQLRRGKDTSER